MAESWDFMGFLTETAPALTRYCAAIAGCADGEDAAQEALIRTWQHRDRIPGEAAAAAFAYRTAYRLCVDLLRRRKRERAAWEELTDRGNPSAESFSERTAHALRQLTPCDRAIVYSRVVEEMPYSRIAARFGKTEAWVRKRYSLARKKLEKTLGKE
ncbi:MAG: RNA polymerase sigma factor [Clostridia bacterium]|nr:RNA polymerase sigma factor [Clostridia bacterium]